MTVYLQSVRQLLPKASAPSRASFQGIAAEVRQLEMTANGQPERSSALPDCCGIWLPCAALGQHAEYAQLKDGTELPLYFCTAQGPICSHAAAIHLLNDAAIIGLAHYSVKRSKRTAVQIVDQLSNTV